MGTRPDGGCGERSSGGTGEFMEDFRVARPARAARSAKRGDPCESPQPKRANRPFTRPMIDFLGRPLAPRPRHRAFGVSLVIGSETRAIQLEGLEGSGLTRLFSANF